MFNGTVSMAAAGVSTTAPGATIDWSTFDLDPQTPAVDTTYVVNSSITLTFDPSSATLTMIGLVPYGVCGDIGSYVVNDSNGNLSNIAVISACPPA